MARIYKARGLVASQLDMNTDPAFYNFTAVVTFFSDEFVTPVTPSAGTVAVTGHIPGAKAYAPFSNSPIDATDDAAYASAGAPLDAISASTTGIVGATHYEITVTATGG